MEEKTKEEQLTLLNDTIAHYTENVNRRCIVIMSGNNFKCKYSGTSINNPESEGCAIGRLLTPEQRLFLDRKYDGTSSGVSNVWTDLPDEIKAYGQPFLIALQKLHDDSGYWGNEGLTDTGLRFVQEIKEKFNLVESN